MKLLHYNLLGAVDQFGPFTSRQSIPSPPEPNRTKELSTLSWAKLQGGSQTTTRRGEHGQGSGYGCGWAMGRGVRILSFSHSRFLVRVLKRYACTVSNVRTDRYTKPKPKPLTDSVLDAMIDMQVTLLGLG